MNYLIQIGVESLYLLALINPVSKVAVLSAFPASPSVKHDLRALAWRASLVAAGMLFVAMVAGDFVLSNIFRVDLNSLRLVGGIVLFWVGFNALRHGVFFEEAKPGKFSEVALVPMACPMIAGPATITACITLRQSHDSGLFITTAAMIVAVGVNYGIMLLSRPIAKVLARYDLLGAVVRMTGLVVMAMGSQMTMDGISGWMAAMK